MITINQFTKYLLLFLLSISAERLEASHLYGGEIRWDCLADGRYQFFVDVYVDCTGIEYTPRFPALTILGYPLPKNAQNNSINRLPLESYSTEWLKRRDRDLSPECTPRNNYGPISCEDEDNGSFQMYSYKTLPTRLKGTPPQGGWTFKLNRYECCRPDFENYRDGGYLGLRAIMYPVIDDSSKKVININPCIDNSPQFKSIPVNNICRGNKFTYNLTPIDYDLDSIAISWGKPIDSLRYKSGFDFRNPTPGHAVGYDNIPSTLDTITGLIKMKIDSGVGVAKYLFVIKVDSYRNGQKNATVFRELPITVFDCPGLPNGNANKPPEVSINNKVIDNEIIEIIAGDRTVIPIVVSDSDNTGVLPIPLQYKRLVPIGLMLTEDRTSSTFCDSLIGNGNNLLVEPCAYLSNRDPFKDTNLFPPFPSIRGYGVLRTNFIWQTDCRHIQTKTGAPGSNQGIYRFVMRVTDDHCPIPAINYPTLTIKVRDPYPLKAPIIKGVSVDLNGNITYQWVPPIDSSNIFKSYLVEYSNTIDRAPPIWSDTLDTDITIYKKANLAPSIYMYNASDPPKISQTYKKRDFYIRMSTKFISCSREGTSDPSEAARIIELDAKIDKNEPNGGKIILNWNAPKPSNAITYPYFKYESNTHYYIWRNDSSTVRALKNWRIVGETSKTNFNLPNNSCGEHGAFRIEARDTVITLKQGSSTRSNINQLDTLTFSTFSLIDTVLLEEDTIPPYEFIIDVLSFDHKSGEVVVNWDTPNPGGIDSIFFISSIDYASTPPDYKVIGAQKWDIVPKQYRIPANKVDATVNSVKVGAIAKDACANQKFPNKSTIHTTIAVDVQWERCDSSMYIYWNNYENFNGDELEYKLLVDSVGNNIFKQVVHPTMISEGIYKHKIYNGGKNYRYLIQASWKNSKDIEVTSSSNIDSSFASYQKEPKVGYISNVTVLNSEYIQLDYLLDTVTSVKSYSILRGIDSTKLGQLDLIPSDVIESNKLTYFDKNVDVNKYAYYYQVHAKNDCDFSFHTSNFGSSIFLEVESGKTSLKNVLKWNSYKKWEDNISHYNIYRGVDQLPTSRVYKIIEGNKRELQVYADDVSGHTDAIGKYCYQVEAVRNTQGQNKGEVSRSNLFCLSIKPLFYIPNAFVPGGVNTVFLPKGQFIDHSYYQLKIFNRIGSELFSTRDINEGWDGTYNGQLVKPGTYVYIIQFSDAEGEDHLLKGTVTLLK